MTLVAALVVTVLGGLALRRLLLVGATVARPRPTEPAPEAWPSVTLVVPACNEIAGIDATLAAIAALDYPVDRLFVVLVDDHSDDATSDRLERWARDRPRTQTLRLPRRAGKPGAVEAGMRLAPDAELIAICDADVRPRADYLRRVVGVFSDETVGGAVGYLAPSNALASAVASYAAVESWLHQLVTSAGKDRLDLNPPTLGGAPVFRRTALESIGGLGPGPSGDDVRVTVALTRAGWRTRFIADAVAANEVASRPNSYWRQHLRWARDLYATAGVHRRTVPGVPILRRVEAWVLSAGYVDRVVLVAALGLVVAGRLSAVVPAAYLGIAAAEVVWAIVRAGEGRRLPLLCLRLAAVFPLDVAGSVAATARHLVARRTREAAPDATRR